MVMVILNFLQSLSIIQQHLFFRRVPHLYRFAIPLVHFSVAQLDLQRPAHSAIQADEAMLTLDSGSISLSRLARGDSAQMIWLGGHHSDPFKFDTTVLCCMTVAPLGMFLLAYLFDTYLLIFEGHAS